MLSIIKYCIHKIGDEREGDNCLHITYVICLTAHALHMQGKQEIKQGPVLSLEVSIFFSRYQFNNLLLIDFFSPLAPSQPFSLGASYISSYGGSRSSSFTARKRRSRESEVIHQKGADMCWQIRITRELLRAGLFWKKAKHYIPFPPPPPNVL